ncbi:MAG: hypothetical protein MJ229_08165 [bacterium]|nr:hypothetical protein [bacterium]
MSPQINTNYRQAKCCFNCKYGIPNTEHLDKMSCGCPSISKNANSSAVALDGICDNYKEYE